MILAATVPLALALATDLFVIVRRVTASAALGSAEPAEATGSR